MDKQQYVRALAIMLELDKEAEKDFNKLSKRTVQQIYGAYLYNAKAYNELERRYERLRPTL